MAATVYLLLWAAIGLIGPKATPAETPAATAPIRAEVPRAAPAVAPPDLPAPPPIVAGLSGLPGDSGVLVGQMQRALTKKGYRVGAEDHFDADTASALQAFQDDKALTVQPTCDQQCWNALGLADPK
jgi:peptidoglycan hydrolase-like protein with peptidoglycan-binding domain